MEERLISLEYCFHPFSFLGSDLGKPFEHMSIEVGRELGNNLGKIIESDRRTKHSNQAKFMRIIEDLQLVKPLRRGGRVVNVNGEKFSWF